MAWSRSPEPDDVFSAPVTLRIVLLVLLVAYGVALGTVGVLGWRQRLALGGRLGVRTPAALRDADTFRLANRIAGPPETVAGLVAVLGGIAAVAVSTLAGTIVAAVIGLVGAGVIARAGSVLGTRAAAALPMPVRSPCAGCICGASACARV
jgi:hypothetical protein